MAYTAIGLGSTPNDGQGDTLLTAGTSINANFVELYTALGTGSAISSGISADATIVTLTSPVINTGVSGTAVLDDDTFGTATATTIATSESIKAYVDAQILTEDTIDELNDTNITSAADGSMLLYDTGTSMWIDNVMSGDATLLDTGALTIANDAIGYDKLENVQSLIIYASAPTTATADCVGGTSTTALEVDGNSGTIATGMVVSGTGVSTTNPPSVVTVTDQNNLVLSHDGNTIANDAALTFTATVKIIRGAGDAA